jgi:hypothetical protein
MIWTSTEGKSIDLKMIAHLFRMISIKRVFASEGLRILSSNMNSYSSRILIFKTRLIKGINRSTPRKLKLKTSNFRPHKNQISQKIGQRRS